MRCDCQLVGVLAIFASAGVVACSRSGVGTGHGGGVPAKHRPTEIACPEQRGPGTTNSNPQSWDECTQDSDCTAGTNGRCLQSKLSFCSYDTCFSDSDCSDNRLCECRPSADDSAPNSCIAGNCHIDADCGADGFCSPSVVDESSTCGYDSSTGDGYFCHTPQDSCVDDSDCGSTSICAYNLPSSHWTCIVSSVCY